MKIVYVYADSPAEWDRSERRCAVPARAINRTSRHSATMISRADFITSSSAASGCPERQACVEADLIVVQGPPAGRLLKAVQYWRARDKAVAADIDRAEHMPAALAKAAGRAGLSSSDPATTVRTGLKLVHGATLPSRRLAVDCQEWAQVFHLPSYIEPDCYGYQRREPDGQIIIGWRGRDSHHAAFIESGAADALRNVCRVRPQVRVLLCTSDTRLYDAVGLPAGQLIRHPWAPFAEWPNLLATLDIGIAPLYGEYDQRRCWSQVLEYMIQRIPWVASAGPVFQDLAQYGWLINPQPQAWERVLLDIVDHLDEYRLEAEHDAYLFALSQSIDENIDKVVDIYTRIAASAVRDSSFSGARAG